MRARQLRRWVLIRAPSRSSRCPIFQKIFGTLADEMVPLATRIVHQAVAADRTHKLVLEMTDGKTIECVLICDGAVHGLH